MDIDVDTRVVVYGLLIVFAVYYRFCWDLSSFFKGISHIIYATFFSLLLTCLIFMAIFGIAEGIKKIKPGPASNPVYWAILCFILFAVAGAFYPVIWDIVGVISISPERVLISMLLGLAFGLVIAFLVFLIWKGLKAFDKDKAPLYRQTVSVDPVTWLFITLLFTGLYYSFAYSLLGTDNSLPHIICSLIWSFALGTCMSKFIKIISNDFGGAKPHLVFDPEIWGIALFVLMGGFYPVMSCILSITNTIPERAATYLVFSGILGLLIMMILIIGLAKPTGTPAGEAH